MRRVGLLILGTALIVACGDESTAPTQAAATIGGTYVLQTVNGLALPATVGTLIYNADTLVFKSDYSWTRALNTTTVVVAPAVPVTALVRFNGDFVQSVTAGDTVTRFSGTVRFPVTNVPFTGRVSGITPPVAGTTLTRDSSTAALPPNNTGTIVLSMVYKKQ